MSFSTVSLTAYHYVLPISPYTGVISIPRRKDPRRRRKARVLPRAAIVEARPQALPAIKEVTGGNNAVPFRRRDSSFRDRTGDMQAEARAMTRAANASVYSPELLLVNTAHVLSGFCGGLLKYFWPWFIWVQAMGLSTRPDLCPPEYLEELSELQDALPTFPDAEAFSCIERELGLPLDSIYSSISPSPIAAASLGQVYKAQLKYSGQIVAVKVNGLEGQNARRFKKLYADKADVLVPDIFWDYTSRKVLTMDWVDGVKLNEQEAIEGQGLKVLDLVNTGIQCSLRQLLEYGYFHADPHPGNLLATPDGKLAFLDFGMMSETPEDARSAIIGHVVHMVNRDYEAMARDYYALDFLSPEVDVSPIVPALRNFFDDALNSTVSELNFKTLVDGLGAVLYQYPFNVPAYYALILRSLTVLEGLALMQTLILKWNRLENLLVQGKKDRDFSAKDALQPVLKLLLGPDGEELRALVIKESVRVSEAVILGSMLDTYNFVPSPMRTLIFNGNATGPLMMSDAEQNSLMELRAQVFRIWGLLRESDNFDPSLLQPLLQQVLQEPEARSLGGSVIGRITQRLAARLLQQVLRAPTAPPVSTS
ncbi:hypothetical protein C3L33_17780, partial [Rhododendron williamsianum]